MTDPFLLPQSLILRPETAFAQVEACLTGLGFSQIETGTVTRPVRPGEPELARWRFRDGLPIVEYSFNPVVNLRLLEVATTPPDLRGQIAERLHPLPAAAAAAALSADDDRRRLFGVWAAVQTERIDLIQEVTRVFETSRGVLREEAESALHRLSDLAQARVDMLQSAQMIREAAIQALASLSSADDLADLAPDDDDCAALFDQSIVEGVRREVRMRAPFGPHALALPAAARDITPAPAGALRWSNELSERFPRGYRRIAGWMEPSRIWLAWNGREPDGGVMKMDGLAFVNSHWVFLPKPWRIVEPMIADRLGRAPAERN